MQTQRSLVVLTGASRGLGRAIGVAFASSIQIPILRVVLVSRTDEDLCETASLMEAASAKSSTQIDISQVVADLSDLEKLETVTKECFDSLVSEQYERAIFNNNAGSLGHLGRASTMPSLAELQHSINFNVTSSIWMSSQFSQMFTSPEGECRAEQCIIVNISSLCAIEAFKTMSVYCAGKAARDMFHSVLAKEEESNESIKILNYAPGMLETQMSVELAKSEHLDQDLSSMYRNALKEKTMVQPKDTAEKLLCIIIDDKWKNGAHIDYWDE